MKFVILKGLPVEFDNDSGNDAEMNNVEMVRVCDIYKAYIHHGHENRCIVAVLFHDHATKQKRKLYYWKPFCENFNFANAMEDLECFYNECSYGITAQNRHPYQHIQGY